MPAPTMRETPLPAPIAFSSVNLLGWSTSFCPIGEQVLEPGSLSLEADRDLDNVPLSACFNELPFIDPGSELANEIALLKEVSLLFGVSADERSVSSYEVFTDDDASEEGRSLELTCERDCTEETGVSEPELDSVAASFEAL